MRWDTYGGWPEYVPVRKRIAAAEKAVAKRAKALGRKPEPVTITGREIAKTFWGRSWCRNLECYSDVSSRLPRGRTYARNGSVVDLLITRSRIEAIVAGSLVYDVTLAIDPLSPVKWRAIKADCASSIGSLVDLLTGRLDDDVMRRLTRPIDGMFPAPREITVRCTCPDGARLCKHLAAVLYAIGHRLDTQPELLFLLRGVDQTELVAAATKESVSRAVRGDVAHAIAAGDVAEIFGIDMGSGTEPPPSPPAAPHRARAAKRAARPKAVAAPAAIPPPKLRPLTRKKRKPTPARKPKRVPKRKPAGARKPAGSRPRRKR